MPQRSYSTQPRVSTLGPKELSLGNPPSRRHVLKGRQTASVSHQLDYCLVRPTPWPFSINCRIAWAGIAPACRATSRPDLSKANAGIELT